MDSRRSMGRAFKSEDVLVLFAIRRPLPARLPYQMSMLWWVERPGLLDVACPVTHEKLKLAFIQMLLGVVPMSPLQRLYRPCNDREYSPVSTFSGSSKTAESPVSGPVLALVWQALRV